MLTFMRRGSRGRKDDSSRIFSPFAGSPETSRNRVVGQAVDEDGLDEDDGDDEAIDQDEDEDYFDRRGNGGRYDEDAGDEDGDEDAAEDDVQTPLLPIFSAAHLDKLPLYNITHAIRLLIVPRCETTLSWDQLRSPQVSQFLVKPIQSQIRTNHFNRATLCALIANCLQFQKEAQTNPGNVGVLSTRALIAELLAMRLIKEFTTRELIDALSYDFDPLQGMASSTNVESQRPPQQDLQSQRTQAKGARVSTIEIAIRAQSKRFLSHQLVVQHLEAIWAGTIVFHSQADNLHRRVSVGEEPHNRERAYGTTEHSALPADAVLSRKSQETRTSKRPSVDVRLVRRSVTLYNPRDASFFKLSRLRVPRYRQVFSTISFAIMLGLFLAVLIERSVTITPLEVIFWFWSIGYMLDEVVGFTEQGFGLYILSFWNAFDAGILLLFVTYYCLRLYGIVLAGEGQRRIANSAYDVLASTAVLLFPRLFSVLDHYRYFSQLLIAFRMMAQDLMAVLFLIIISCSGFFVAFTLSFGDEKAGGSDVAFALFQILMGFTPAAWDRWTTYNLLGKTLLGAFLIIGHFVIVTILITVLTNSFMAIVKNAHEEHQFLFAINTISMVKSDALFSYIAPTNVFGWMLSPVRFVMPFRQFVKLNRTVIKVSHFPILFGIFCYERLILSKVAYAPLELVEKQPTKQRQPIAFSVHHQRDTFSPTHRLLREPSIISFNKDRALDEVFRQPFRGSTVRTTPREMGVDRQKSQNVVSKWIQAAEIEGGASPPLEQPRSVVERLENRRPPFRRAATADRAGSLLGGRRRDFSSDPDIMSTIASRRPYRIDEEGEGAGGPLSDDRLVPDTEADGDDDNNLESEAAGPAIGESISVFDKENRTPLHDSDDDDDEAFYHPSGAGKSATLLRTMDARALQPIMHNRKISTDTALFAPPQAGPSSSAAAQNSSTIRRLPNPLSTRPAALAAFDPIDLPPTGRRSPKLKPRPPMPARQKTAPAAGLSFLDIPRASRRDPSFSARALDLASEIGDNKFVSSGGGGMLDVGGGISGFPNSFSEQILRASELRRRREEERREEEKGRVNRIMLARMQGLEEGFREVLKEIKVLSSVSIPVSAAGSEGGTTAVRSQGRREIGEGVERGDGGAGAGASRSE
ncbi:hypothetical protein BDY17DRAFT_265110 [Neohortaea acidophila]|uniref:Ion transport domain-containing protein n=1 Tax=Neohortaea acidophila TaxID=245834 RepID=A0A6A6PT29_9PEZI|nr:uncharacterized protein BDY17DRAFT_265110 [Neohortaea acidophila]KAF2482926.1 hypothetical protein BDY17DRAFT_265110 [Neohortaea acidophila]